MFAVFEALGRQYKVSEGDVIRVDRVSENNQDTPEGTKITFDQVLLVSDEDGENVQIGKPTLNGAKIEGEVIEQGKEKKGVAYKKKRRKGYTRKVGFRRAFTAVKIKKIAA